MRRPSEFEPTQPQTPFMRTPPPFVGRRQPLQRFAACVQAALGGQPQVVLLAGEAGMGKTRLLSEVHALARHRGACACYGRGCEDVTVPYLAWGAVWRAQLGQLPAALEPALNVSAAVIRQALQRQRSPSPVGPLARSDQAD
jgi:predicted ATPase